jgi:hypothetical protein
MDPEGSALLIPDLPMDMILSWVMLFTNYLPEICLNIIIPLLVLQSGYFPRDILEANTEKN